MRGGSALVIVTAALVVDSLIAPFASAVGVRSAVQTVVATNQALIDLAEVPLRLPNRDRPERPAEADTDSDRDRLPSGSRPSLLNPNRAEFKYRLIVQGSSETLLRQIRQVVPDAFRTTVDGQRVIQAGLFVEREEAEMVQQQLDQRNIQASLFDFVRAARPTASATSGTDRTGFNYRLVIQGSSDSLLRQVRRLIPDAFRTTVDGQRVIQAGLFVERAEAETIQRQLSQINAETNIFDVGYGVTQQPLTTGSSPPRARDGRVLVVVDPGHGGGDPGAVGIGGIHEADIVLEIAQRVAALLEEQGLQSILTRQDDREIDLEPRVDLAESLNADLFVSIHANAISLSRPDVNGIETYYYDSGAALASAIHNSLVSTTGMEDRGIRQARFYVLTNTSMPAVLVEVGFVTGQADAARLSSSTSRSQIAEGIARGILRYTQQRL